MLTYIFVSKIVSIMVQKIIMFFLDDSYKIILNISNIFTRRSLYFVIYIFSLYYIYIYIKNCMPMIAQKIIIFFLDNSDTFISDISNTFIYIYIKKIVRIIYQIVFFLDDSYTCCNGGYNSVIHNISASRYTIVSNTFTWL